MGGAAHSSVSHHLNARGREGPTGVEGAGRCRQYARNCVRVGHVSPFGVDNEPARPDFSAHLAPMCSALLALDGLPWMGDSSGHSHKEHNGKR
jgi:hypothetical protein